MKLPAFSPRRFFLSVLTAVFLLSFASWGVWTLAAAQYRRTIDKRIESAQAAGYQIAFDDRQIFGFPERITMRLIHPHSQSGKGISFQTDILDITTSPWNFSDFDVKFKSPLTITVPLDESGGALSLASDKGDAHIKLDSEGIWRQAKLSLTHSKIGFTPNYLFEAENLDVSVARPLTPPQNHTEAGLTVAFEADKIVTPNAMPTPFGDKADRLAAHMRVMGLVPDVRKRASVDAWNKESGIVEFDDFSLDWGVLAVQSKGTLGFDDDLQPEGAFAGALKDPEKTMRALLSHGFIAMHDQDMLAEVMKIFAQSPGGDKAIQLPITIQLGGLFLGPVRIFAFPAIEWPTEPPPVKQP